VVVVVVVVWVQQVAPAQLLIMVTLVLQAEPQDLLH
jgi:hypothetical protein